MIKSRAGERGREGGRSFSGASQTCSTSLPGFQPIAMCQDRSRPCARFGFAEKPGLHLRIPGAWSQCHWRQGCAVVFARAKLFKRRATQGEPSSQERSVQQMQSPRRAPCCTLVTSHYRSRYESLRHSSFHHFRSGCSGSAQSIGTALQPWSSPLQKHKLLLPDPCKQS